MRGDGGRFIREHPVVLILLVRGIVRHPLGRWGCVLLLAGGLGNLIDRFRLGYVVDVF